MTLNLPKTYEATLDKFRHHNGKPKFSYSQYTSYNDSQYTNQYILQYIFKKELPDNFWAVFGSYCGTALEYRMKPENADKKDAILLKDAFEYFNKKDIETLYKADTMFPENAVYEREIVLDRGSYVIQGFIDVNYTKHNKEIVLDNKTGNKNSKTKGTDFYKSDKYGQTRLYAKALKDEGEDIGYVGVVFLDRTYQGEFTDPILHLSGDILNVETSYCEDKVSILLKDIDRTVKEVSDLKTTYDILHNLTIEV